MTPTGAQQIELNVARCRLLLAAAGILAVYLDPAEPLASRWIALMSGLFVIDFRVLLLIGTYFGYGLLVYASLRREWVTAERLVAPTLWIDILFGAIIGTLTEGVTSPSYPFFAFAVLTAGLRAGFMPAILATAASVVLYECLILISTQGSAQAYIMRPVYLAITGYLVGYLGQRHLQLQEEVRHVKVSEERHRIGRDLHDNFAQALAGINLRLESCRRQLQADHPAADVLAELTELQDSVKREFDDLRAYTHSLAGLEGQPALALTEPATRLSLSVDLSGSLDLVDHILQIAREGIRNVCRHAGAKTAKIDVRAEHSQVCVSIEDDGLGFQGDAPPWSIASRVKEIGGQVRIVDHPGHGAHLLITVPQS
jgi:signal transduction histidine kinase